MVSIEYKPVRDNRTIHHISSQVISPKILSVANLSCYECDECLFDDNTKCTNSEYCGERRVLQWMEYMNRKERDSNDYMYENESVSDLVTIVSVAVLADDDEYDYYLMKVSKVPFQLERVENDDWGNTFPVGANVAGVIIITEGNKIHLNMNLFEEG
jgi:hypothetical protein